MSWAGRLACGAVLFLLLSGCQVTQGPSWQLLERWRATTAAPVPPRLDPAYPFLRLTRDGMQAHLVLGYRTTRSGGGLPVSVLDHWYSADQVLLALQDGRISQLLGTQIEWRAVQQAQRPEWSELAVAPVAQPRTWTRHHDEMPGYRYGLSETIRSQRVDRGMPTSLDQTVLPVPLAALRWVLDEVEATRPDGSRWSYRQWFALGEWQGRWQVLWSLQCTAPHWCLELQPLAQVPAT